MNRLHLMAIAAAAAAVALPVSAASTASAQATLGNLTLTLYDLNPLDSITPSITFATGGYLDNNGWASAQQYGGPSAGEYWYESFASSTGPWEPGSAAAVTAFSDAQATLSGPGALTGTTLHTSGQASSPGDNSTCSIYGCTVPSATFSAYIYAPYVYYNQGFTLSANTLVSISAFGEVAAESNEGGSYEFAEYPGIGYYSNSAAASVSLQVSGPAAGGGNGSQNSYDQRGASASSYFDYYAQTWINQSSNDSGPLGVSFVNLTGADMSGSLQAYASSSGYAYGNATPAVPEPGTYALLLAGLGVVVSLARRRAH